MLLPSLRRARMFFNNPSEMPGQRGSFRDDWEGGMRYDGMKLVKPNNYSAKGLPEQIWQAFYPEQTGLFLFHF